MDGYPRLVSFPIASLYDGHECGSVFRRCQHRDDSRFRVSRADIVGDSGNIRKRPGQPEVVPWVAAFFELRAKDENRSGDSDHNQIQAQYDSHPKMHLEIDLTHPYALGSPNKLRKDGHLRAL